MPNSSATTAALAWLRSGHAPAQRVSEVVRALALLSGEVPVTPAALKCLGPDVEMALLVEADARGLVDLVATLGHHATHKPTVKHAKKLLFRARQRGVSTPERPISRAPVDLTTRPEPLPSFATSFDPSGTQVLFLGGWSTLDGPWCAVGVVSDEEGLLSALYLPDTSRTHQREMMEQLRTQLGVLPVEVPAAFAAGRIRWGLDRRLASGKPIDGDQPEIRRAVSQADPLHAIEFALDPQDEARLDALMAEARPLASDPWFSDWLAADTDLLTSLDRKLSAARSEPLPDDDTLARETLVAERWTAIQGWFDAARRLRWAERFELSAWLLVQAGRRETAMHAVATARGLRDVDRPLGDLGYVDAAVERLAPLGKLLDFERRRSAPPPAATAPGVAESETPADAAAQANG
jgi:hypothetical protein